MDHVRDQGCPRGRPVWREMWTKPLSHTTHNTQQGPPPTVHPPQNTPTQRTPETTPPIAHSTRPATRSGGSWKLVSLGSR